MKLYLVIVTLYCILIFGVFTVLTLFLVPVEDCTINLFGATTIPESSTFISICVELNGPTTNDVLVNYNTLGLTATGIYNTTAMFRLLTLSLPQSSVQLVQTSNLSLQ